ncbi:hypothetical protein EZV62_007687 [Acer yangbiense]|uniref:Uncharacterized protein n=1 Tax=Acer yangbiense TaxID=1000413 RepID=A0A5C7IC88_9ROSI|nr:hypothetical protein EZV62_007687 [Acer yangbiense]
MASDSEVAARVDEQTRCRGEQRTHTKRSKSKGPRLDDLKTDYGEITQATKSMIREFQKGFKEDLCFLTQEVRNLRTFVEHELRAVRAEVEEVHTEWASYRNSPSVSLGATTSTNTIQIPKPSTYSGNHKAMEVENFLFSLEQYFEAKGNVQDLDTAIAVAESLADYTQLKERKDIHEKSGADKSKDHNHKDKGCSKSPNSDNQRDKPNEGKPEAIKLKVHASYIMGHIGFKTVQNGRRSMP